MTINEKFDGTEGVEPERLWEVTLKLKFPIGYAASDFIPWDEVPANTDPYERKPANPTPEQWGRAIAELFEIEMTAEKAREIIGSMDDGFQPSLIDQMDIVEVKEV